MTGWCSTAVMPVMALLILCPPLSLSSYLIMFSRQGTGRCQSRVWAGGMQGTTRELLVGGDGWGDRRGRCC